MEGQTTIFDMLYPKYKITKPIRLIEFFAGYGSQALALKYLGVKFEHYKICEWAVKSIQAYKDIHFPNDNEDYSMLNNLSYEKLVDILYNYGISQNYNEPMKLEQIKRLGEKQARKIFNNIVATHNLVNIQKVKGYSLEIEDTDKYEYIMTYSFPCQDLSLAGKGKGMSDTSTRSGMLWEVERILQECKDLGTLPQILLMENVPQVKTNDPMAWERWLARLEELGYKNYHQDLIATDYGIPQTRNRCFMVSILGDYSYTFPKPIPLKLKLKDMLEDNVDEKYFLSDKQLESLESGSYNASKPSVKLANTDKGLCQTLDTMSGGNRQPLVRVANKSLQKTLEQNEINDICYIDTYNKRIDKDKSGTITTGVSFRNNTFLAIKDKPKVLGGYGKIGSTGQYHQQNRVYDDKVAISVTTAFNPYYKSDLRIRKLTPKECFRLMGVKDEDFEKCAKNQSDSSLYHLAGDSIVVDILCHIFKELIN